MIEMSFEADDTGNAGTGGHTWQLRNSLSATLAAYQIYSMAEADPDLWHEIQSEGIDLDHVTNLAGPIVRSLATIEDGRVHEDEFGETVFLVSALAEDAETLVDLVAWSVRNPENFGSMFGSAILGIDQVFNPSTYVAGPCCLYSSPLAWLQAGCAGAVVLDYGEAKLALESAQGPFTTDTVDHALHLYRSGLLPPERLLISSDWRVPA